MLYCLQVAPAQELKTLKEIRVIVSPECVSDVFYLTRKRWRRYHGNRHLVTERLMHGYLFLDSEDVDTLYQQLKKVPTLTKILDFKNWDLEERNGSFVPLHPEEDAFIRRLAMGEGAAAPGVIDVSGVELTEGSRVRVVSGPLKGMEEHIIRLDMHHGVAALGVKLLGRSVEMLVGVESLEKTPEPKPRKRRRRRRSTKRVRVEAAD